MSTSQRTRARVISVDRETADVLRLQAKKIMVFSHELFEDFLEFGPEAQHVLAMRFRDACELINTIGWDPAAGEAAGAETFEIALTGDLIEQLRQRRYDLAFTNKDRLDGLDINEPIAPELLAEITVDRLAAGALHRLIGAYGRAATA